MTGTVQAGSAINGRDFINGRGLNYNPGHYSSEEQLLECLDNTCDYNSAFTGIITELDGAVRIACGITVHEKEGAHTIEIDCGCPIVNNTQYQTVCTIDTGVNIRDSGHIRDRTVYIENVETQSIVQDIELKDQELESAKSAMNPTQYRPPQPIYPLGSLAALEMAIDAARPSPLPPTYPPDSRAALEMEIDTFCPSPLPPTYPPDSRAALTPSQTISGPSFTNEGNSAAQYLPLPPTQFACTSAALTPSQTISGPSFTNEGNSAAQYLPPQPIYPLGSFAALEREMNPTQYLPPQPHLSPWSGPHQDIDTPPPKRPRLDATFTEPRLAPRPGIVGAEYDAGIQSEVISKHKKHQNMELESVEDGNSLMDDNMVANEPVQKRRRMRRAVVVEPKELKIDATMLCMLEYCDESVLQALMLHIKQDDEKSAQVNYRRKQCHILMVQLRLIHTILSVISDLSTQHKALPINIVEINDIEEKLNRIIDVFKCFIQRSKDRLKESEIYYTRAIRIKIRLANKFFIPAILERIVTIYNDAINKAHHITVKDLFSPINHNVVNPHTNQHTMRGVIGNMSPKNLSRTDYNKAKNNYMNDILRAWETLANEYQEKVSKEMHERYLEEDEGPSLIDDDDTYADSFLLMTYPFAALQKLVSNPFFIAQKSSKNPAAAMRSATQCSLSKTGMHMGVNRTVGTKTDFALREQQKDIKQEEHILGKQLWETYLDNQADIKCIKGMSATQGIESIQDIKNIEKNYTNSRYLLAILSKCFVMMRMYVLGKYASQESIHANDIWAKVIKAIRLEAQKSASKFHSLKLAFINLARKPSNPGCHSSIMEILCRIQKHNSSLIPTMKNKIQELITNINNEGITILDTLVGDNLDDQKSLIRSGRFLKLILLVALHVSSKERMKGATGHGMIFILKNTCTKLKHLNSEDTPGFDARPKAKLIRFSWLEEFIDQLHSLDVQTCLQTVGAMDAKEKELLDQGTITKEEGVEALYILLLPKSKAPGELDEAGCEQIQEELGEPRAAALCYTA